VGRHRIAIPRVFRKEMLAPGKIGGRVQVRPPARSALTFKRGLFGRGEKKKRGPENPGKIGDAGKGRRSAVARTRGRNPTPGPREHRRACGSWPKAELEKEASGAAPEMGALVEFKATLPGFPRTYVAFPIPHDMVFVGWAVTSLGGRGGAGGRLRPT